MSRPKLLDLFAGAGGASVGYERAGFEVVGVDIKPHLDYPYTLVVGDAMSFLRSRRILDAFDVVAASPPCPAYSSMTSDPSKHVGLIEPVRDLLKEWGGPYVIENVPGAKRHMHNPVQLCGSAFDLAVRRHRLFESNLDLVPTECFHARQGRPAGVYGDHPDSREYLRPNGTKRGSKATSLAEAQWAMGIDWMQWDDLRDAIPPAYTEFIGAQLIDHLVSERVA